MKGRKTLSIHLDANGIAGELRVPVDLIVLAVRWGLAPTPKVTLRGRWIWPEEDLTAFEQAINGLNLPPEMITDKGTDAMADELMTFRANCKAIIKAADSAITTADINERFRCLQAIRNFREAAFGALQEWRAGKDKGQPDR